LAQRGALFFQPISNNRHRNECEAGKQVFWRTHVFCNVKMWKYENVKMRYKVIE
jgi:hypothetical protein